MQIKQDLMYLSKQNNNLLNNQSDDGVSFEHGLDHFDLEDTNNNSDDSFENFPRVVLFNVSFDSLQILEVQHPDFPKLLVPFVDVYRQVLCPVDMLPVVLLKRILNVWLLDKLFSVHWNQFRFTVIDHSDQVHRISLTLEHNVILVVKLPFIHHPLVVLVYVHSHCLFLFNVLGSHVSIVLCHVCVKVDCNLLSSWNLDEKLRWT